MKSPVVYYPPEEIIAFFSPNHFFDRLMEELEWYNAGEQVPRKEYYVHSRGLPYIYGKGQFAREYQSQPDHPVIDYFRRTLKAILDVDFDVVFLNLYEHERHHLGWHADNSPEMSDEHPIVTVSLGAERDIWFKENGSKEVEILTLQSGSAAVMLPGMQDTHLHRIPKHHAKCGPRISLTFRKYVYEKLDGKP